MFKELFDICFCKCLNKGLCQRDQCRCATKVPAIEWDFWCDQNSERKMSIGPVDEKTTTVLQRRCERKETEGYRQCLAASTSAEIFEHTEEDTSCSTSPDASVKSSDSEDKVTNPSDDDYDINRDEQNRRQYPNLCEIMERTGLSNRDACKIINACLQDMGLDQSENWLEASKLRRQRTY